MRKQDSWPWITGIVVGISWLVYFWPGASDWLLLDRSAVYDGEFWRMYSGHWTHFSTWHLGVDSMVLAVAGSFVERRDRGRWLIYLVASPWIISTGLFALRPGMEAYGGLSGVATGAVVLWIVGLQERSPKWKKAGWILLGIVGLKVAFEFGFGGTAFVSLETPGVRGEPVCHLLGAVVGVLLGWCSNLHWLSTLRFGQRIEKLGRLRTGQRQAVSR